MDLKSNNLTPNLIKYYKKSNFASKYNTKTFKLKKIQNPHVAKQIFLIINSTYVLIAVIAIFSIIKYKMDYVKIVLS